MLAVIKIIDNLIYNYFSSHNVFAFFTSDKRHGPLSFSKHAPSPSTYFCIWFWRIPRRLMFRNEYVKSLNFVYSTSQHATVSVTLLWSMSNKVVVFIECLNKESSLQVDNDSMWQLQFMRNVMRTKFQWLNFFKSRF